MPTPATYAPPIPSPAPSQHALYRPPPQVPDRLRALAQVMCCSQEEALALTVRCPVLIGLQPGVMKERLEGLQDVLEMTAAEVRACGGGGGGAGAEGRGASGAGGQGSQGAF